MPAIRFIKARPEISVENGSNMMASLLGAGIPVASSCRGDGVCGKCRIVVADGAKNISPETDLEAGLRLRHGIPSNERLSCQTKILGDVTIDAAYW